MPFDRLGRREFITLLGGASAWPLAARAQQSAMPVIGFLNSGSYDQLADRVRAFLQNLQETGYVEGQNVMIEYRWADGHYDRLPALAADLVRRHVAVIAAAGATPSGLAAKGATTTIPVIFQMGADPVAMGLVASLSRPGGNVTGISSLSGELNPKRLELLHEAIPTATSIGMLHNPANPVWLTDLARNALKDLEAEARSFGVQLHVMPTVAESDFDPAFTSLIQLGAHGLMIAADPLFSNRRDLIASLQFRHRLPTIYQDREFTAAGGLMSYGGSTMDQYRQVGVYTGRILKGEKPGDLPVQQSTKVELIINLKTAATLGVTFPVALLARADEVIE
jgi:putative tryptophan/tyrosine transport system substrate-binding protein